MHGDSASTAERTAFDLVCGTCARGTDIESAGAGEWRSTGYDAEAGIVIGLCPDCADAEDPLDEPPGL